MVTVTVLLFMPAAMIERRGACRVAIIIYLRLRPDDVDDDDDDDVQMRAHDSDVGGLRACVCACVRAHGAGEQG